jgi:hypothetical protein
MTIDLNKAKALAAAAAAVSNQTVAKAGGDFDNTVPEGNCRMRFTQYVELGKQKGTFQGKPVVKNKVLLGFELSGPKHQPRVTDDGKKIPWMMYIEETLSSSSKANFFKLLTVMNYTGAARHMSELLGNSFLGTIVHRAFPKRGEDKGKPETWTGKAAELRPKGGSYTIRPPRVEDVETGDWKDVPVDEPISALRLFIWDLADMDQWGSIFIEGEWDERKDDKGAVISPKRSKNKLQIQIANAENFAGSTMDLLLKNNGVALDLGPLHDDDQPEQEEPDTAIPDAPAAEAVPTGADADDVLNGVA